MGGTFLKSGDNEIAANFSSGGFSEYFKRPIWQNVTVRRYLHRHGSQWSGYYNPSGRATPDVAALAWNHQIINHDTQESAGGTR